LQVRGACAGAGAGAEHEQVPLKHSPLQPRSLCRQQPPALSSVLPLKHTPCAGAARRGVSVCLARALQRSRTHVAALVLVEPAADAAVVQRCATADVSAPPAARCTRCGAQPPYAASRARTQLAPQHPLAVRHGAGARLPVRQRQQQQDEQQERNELRRDTSRGRARVSSPRFWRAQRHGGLATAVAARTVSRGT
jgi:hypothetical protein